MTEELSKPVLRAQAAERVAALAEHYRLLADSQIVARLFDLPETRGAEQILTYLALQDEPSLRLLLERAVRRGVRVYAPRMEATTVQMSFVRWVPADGHTAGPGGVWRSINSEGPLAVPTVAFVPGRAFDLDGVRLGRGQGCYDRVLASLRPFATLIGVAYECQLLDRVPKEPHDESVDVVVTEKRTARTRPL